MSIINESKRIYKERLEVHKEKRYLRDKAAMVLKESAFSLADTREALKMERLALLERMLSIDTGIGMTARQVAERMNGDMTISEVINNLTAILLSGKSYQLHFIDGRVCNGTYKNRHGIPAECVSKTEEKRIVYTLECDADGNILKDSNPIPNTRKVTLYHFHDVEEASWRPYNKDWE